MLCLAKDQAIGIVSLESLRRQLKQMILMASDCLQSQRLYEVQGHGKGCRTYVIRRPSFELEGQSVISCLLKGHFLNHLSSPHVRWHLSQHLGFPIESTDPRRAIDLVSTKGIEVGVQRSDINRRMCNRLSPVQEYQSPYLMCQTYDLGHWINRTQHITNMGHRNDTGTRAQERTISLHI